MNAELSFEEWLEEVEKENTKGLKKWTLHWTEKN